MRRIAITAIVAVFALVLSACGDTGPLAKVKVSKDDAPTVTFSKDFSVEKTVSRVITEGDGEKLKKGDTISFVYLAMNGRTAKQFDNTFKTDQKTSITLTEETTLAGFYKGLVGQKVGSRVLVALAPADGAKLVSSAESLGLKETDTMVFLFDILAKVPTEASGEPKKAPANLPSVAYNDEGQPTGFKATKTSDKKLAKTQSAVVIKGKGAKVKAGQTVSAHYVGQKYPDGEIFDESWTTGPRQFQVGAGALIACWDDELVGQTIGSRVIVACTADDAYGKDAKAQGRPDGALIFVVDILDAS